MATYIALNIVVLAIVTLALCIRVKKPSRAWVVTFLSLLLLTFVFDNIMIALGMFTYAPDKILGIQLLLAPVEDFMYPLLACILLPVLWNAFDKEPTR